MCTRLLLLWLCLASVSTASGADETLSFGVRASRPVPAGARVTLEADRREYWIGENVLVHFVLENTGTEPFTFSYGCDYRGSPRALRYRVTMTDEAGREVEDPYPPPHMNTGGLGQDAAPLQPGGRWTDSIPLLCYRAPDHAGRYTVRVTHDLGWKETPERPQPVGEITLDFKLPDETQAEEIVRAMAALPKNDGTTMGQRSTDYPDYSCLRLPVYLGPVLRRIEGGNRPMLSALAEMEIPAATGALIRFAEHPDAEIAHAAAAALRSRLPGAAQSFPEHTRMTERAWEERFRPEVRALAARLLAGDHPSTAVSDGAAVLETVGVVEDATVLLRALDRALEPLVSSRRERTDNILNDPSPVWELVNALRALRRRGFRLPDQSFGGNAGMLLYFDGLAGQPAPRPERWLENLQAYGQGARFPVVEAALRSIPVPMPPECAGYVAGKLEDPDRGICRAACAVAGTSGDKRFVPRLLDLIATENHEWLLREATAAARALRAGFPLLEVWAERLPDERLFPLALDALQRTIELPGSHGGRTDLSHAERLALRAAWREFLARHAKAIRAGKRFPIHDPGVTPALFGRARTFSMPDGTLWPMTNEEQSRTRLAPED